MMFISIFFLRKFYKNSFVVFLIFFSANIFSVPLSDDDNELDATTIIKNLNLSLLAMAKLPDFSYEIADSMIEEVGEKIYKGIENFSFDVNAPDSSGFTALMLAAKYGYYQIIEKLLAYQYLDLCAVRHEDGRYKTALDYALECQIDIKRIIKGSYCKDKDAFLNLIKNYYLVRVDRIFPFIGGVFPHEKSVSLLKEYGLRSFAADEQRDISFL